MTINHTWKGFPGGAAGKESACQCRGHRDVGLIPGCDPMDCSQPSSSINGISQTNTGMCCHFLLHLE